MTEKNSRSGSYEELQEDFGFDGDATVTLDLDDGTTLECAVITIYKALGKQYIALLPLDENGQNHDGEVYLYRFTLDGEEPVLENIEDDEEYDAASDGFDEWLDSQEYDDLVFEDDED